MTTVNTNPLDLMGKTISFKDMELEQRIANLEYPTDFPEHLKISNSVEGKVISVSFELDGKNQICVATDFPKNDNANYFVLDNISDLKILS